MFISRLEKYRNELHLNKREMAYKLQINESYYSLISSGKREPSKALLEKLVLISQLAEEYWLYGISQEDFLNTRDEFKSLKKALDTVSDFVDFENINEIFTEENNPKDSLGRLLIAALKSDIACMVETKRQQRL